VDRLGTLAHRALHVYQKAGLSPGAVWNLEHRGSGSPTSLKKIADVLGVRASELVRPGR
jgi:hypothetical protein